MKISLLFVWNEGRLSCCCLCYLVIVIVRFVRENTSWRQCLSGDTLNFINIQMGQVLKASQKFVLSQSHSRPSFSARRSLAINQMWRNLSEKFSSFSLCVWNTKVMTLGEKLLKFTFLSPSVFLPRHTSKRCGVGARATQVSASEGYNNKTQFD